MLQGTTTSTESSAISTGDQSAQIAAHTPGPWTAYAQGDGTGSGRISPKICICTIKPAANYDSPVDEQIAWTVGSYFNYGSDRYDQDIERNQANARLLAAAPDLLSALTELKNDISKLRWGQSYPGRNHALMDRVEAVIAKATGQKLGTSTVAHGNHVEQVPALEAKEA